MVDEIGRAVSASVSRGLAPISRQVDELIAWRKSVGDLRNGTDGKPGERGDVGPAGKDAPPIDVDAIVSKVAALVPVPKDGRDGANGKDGSPGRDAQPVDIDTVVAKVLPMVPVPKDGRDGRDGADGKAGADGINGKDGTNGADGRDGYGIAGPAGKGIKGFSHDEAAHTLDILMDDGEAFTLRLPVPQRGEKGDEGRDGKDGAQGE